MPGERIPARKMTHDQLLAEQQEWDPGLLARAEDPMLVELHRYMYKLPAEDYREYLIKREIREANKKSDT